jgi:hypothetical protein
MIFDLSGIQTQLTLVGMVLQLASVIFIWKTIAVSDLELKSISAGAILGSNFDILGSRSPAAKMLLTNQYLALVAFLISLIGIMIQFVAAAVNNMLASPVPELIYFLLLLFLFLLIVCGCDRIRIWLVRQRVWRIFNSAVAVWKNNNLKPNSQEETEVVSEMEILLPGITEVDRVRIRATLQAI